MGKVQYSEAPPIFRRIGAGDKTAISDCMDVYGDFVWAIAGKFTHSVEEREAVMTEIFSDIHQIAQDDGDPLQGEKMAIATIALRRLIKNGLVTPSGLPRTGNGNGVAEQKI